MTTFEFADLLGEGTEILRGLRRRCTGLAEAGEVVGSWAARHPRACPRLVLTGRRGEYDLRLNHPEGGTVTLSVPRGAESEQDGRAPGGPLGTDRLRAGVAEALALLQADCRDLRAVIAEQCLLSRELMEDDEPLDEGDLREAVAEFRAGHGLRDRASTLAWLAEMSLSGEQFEVFVTGIARWRRFRRRKEAELAPGHLAAHRRDFDRVRALWVTGSQPVDGKSLRGVGGLVGCGEATVTVGERWARDLPAPLRHAAHDTRVGPMAYGDGYLTGIVLERRAARDDPETLAVAGEAAFREWLAVRRGGPSPSDARAEATPAIPAITDHDHSVGLSPPLDARAMTG
ncbi:hypothetical protein [Microbispora sp. H10836]|uniref:hypothetical protein n=1 Tax=Microbispora sp. H10836 TaxID=2729106 RepID=UPI001473659F|nr:hypothetical protein [Microbispora sp. H10836]